MWICRRLSKFIVINIVRVLRLALFVNLLLGNFDNYDTVTFTMAITELNCYRVCAWVYSNRPMMAGMMSSIYIMAVQSSWYRCVVGAVGLSTLQIKIPMVMWLGLITWDQAMLDLIFNNHWKMWGFGHPNPSQCL